MNANSSLKHSDQIHEIAAALAKAQGEMKPAVFNRYNSYFKNRYADFTSCMDACRIPLSKHGLAISQLPGYSSDGKYILNTFLIHSSGQWMSCEFPLNTKDGNLQSIGSAMTYAKRYSLCGMLGIVADEDIDHDDDDGNSAVYGTPKHTVEVEKNTPNQKPPSPKISKEQEETLKNMLCQLSDEYKKRINDWLLSTHSITSFEDVTVDIYPRVYKCLENAAKLKEKEKKPELANV